MGLIGVLLDKFSDAQAFEALCSEVMLREGYSDITPLGGSGDKGRDAEDVLYSGTSGKRTILFQFTLQKAIRPKVLKTLGKITKAGLKPNQLIFLFSTHISSIKTRDALIEKALEEYQLSVEIKDQRFLAIRLAQPGYRDITTRYFANELQELLSLWEEDKLFFSEDIIAEREQRCLMNLMLYGRNPISGDIREEVVRQAVRRVLARCAKPVEGGELVQLVADYLPVPILSGPCNIAAEISRLVLSNELLSHDNAFSLAPAAKASVELEIGGLLGGREALYRQVRDNCAAPDGLSVDEREIRKACDYFFCALFSRYGAEVANAILDREESSLTISTALGAEQVDELLSETVSTWALDQANRFRHAVRSTLSQPSGPHLEYLNALSRSYVVMQMLNADPDSINVQRARVADSVAIIDTDVVLTGLVDGADRQWVSLGILDLCEKLKLQVVILEESARETVFRIERSIELFEDLGGPRYIPPDKEDLVSDLFLDIYFESLRKGETASFGEFMRQYYNPSDPLEHVRTLIETKLGVSPTSLGRYYILDQNEKVQRLKKTIESARKTSGTFKNPDLYYHDAQEMVVVEQQNRQARKEGRPGRWYLVSSDRHILLAYLKHRDAFQIKPCILPVYFLESLRMTPSVGADEHTFGAILQSEAMLRSVGRDYGPIIAALTTIGIDALSLPRERLLELIEDMDRADFTQWLTFLRSGRKVSKELREEIATALHKVLEEAASREQKVASLKNLLAKAHS